MSNIQILDCTLRDGGYINDFRFGEHSIANIIAQLTAAKIDIIECGFLEDGKTDPDCSLYASVEQISHYLPTHFPDECKPMFVGMACYGKFNINNLTPFDGSSIEGIRITFHYDEVEAALDYIRQVQAKGYKVFVQPVGTTSYSDEQLTDLIEKVNDINPYAFYLVDTLGLMHEEDVMRFFHLIDSHLDADIHLGFHSHNNLQLSYSNCQKLTNLQTERIISLDASVDGMGRAAGNLNTELIANYLNKHFDYHYNIEAILEIVDEHISKIKEKYSWGYSLPYYLAAINGCHPNYASFLTNKHTLTVQNISAILKTIEPQSRSLFNKALIEQKYLEFQSFEIDDTDTIQALSALLHDRNVLLMAPGHTISTHTQEIIECANTNLCAVISVAFIPDFITCDFAFLSNSKRYLTTFNPSKKEVRIIHTSNFKTTETKDTYTVNYRPLLTEAEHIMDNASLMAINLLLKLGVRKIFLAGLDGYSFQGNNYYHDQLNLGHEDKGELTNMNTAMRNRLSQLGKIVALEFVTPSLYNVSNI